MKTIYDVVRIFGVGDVIRSIKPYFGEASYSIQDHNDKGFYCSYNSSILGTTHDFSSTRKYISYYDFISNDGELLFKKCNKLIQIWLWLLGKMSKIKIGE